MSGLELEFLAEERVEGLDTYLFEYRGEIEYTYAYASTDDYVGIDVEPGQEIRCAEAGLVVRYWVEPATGDIVKSGESCLSGDAVYDVVSGEKLYEISRWQGVSAGDDVIQRAALIRKSRQSYLWAARYFPGLLILAGVISLGAGIIPRKPSSDSGPGS